MYMLGPFIGPAYRIETDYDDFQNQWLNFEKKKVKFSKWQKNLSTNKNQTIYCNLGLMHQKDHK